MHSVKIPRQTKDLHPKQIWKYQSNQCLCVLEIVGCGTMLVYGTLLLLLLPHNTQIKHQNTNIGCVFAGVFCCVYVIQEVSLKNVYESLGDFCLTTYNEYFFNTKSFSMNMKNHF